MACEHKQGSFWFIIKEHRKYSLLNLILQVPPNNVSCMYKKNRVMNVTMSVTINST